MHQEIYAHVGITYARKIGHITQFSFREEMEDISSKIKKCMIYTFAAVEETRHFFTFGLEVFLFIIFWGTFMIRYETNPDMIFE